MVNKAELSQATRMEGFTKRLRVEGPGAFDDFRNFQILPVVHLVHQLIDRPFNRNPGVSRNFKVDSDCPRVDSARH